MSVQNHNDHHHEAELASGTGEKTLKLYFIGFFLSIVLTLIPFGLVAKQFLSVENLYIALSICAIAQLYVQVVCFLRLNTSKEGRWTLISFLFTILIVMILVGGSLWIMYNLNYNMVN
jgi:cytochrome o ubiquinol oxidase operon protein cyoD